MTFKPIHLQMSIPRTPEFSGQHGHALHKPVADQNMLANQSAKLTEELRSKNTEVEHTTGLQVRSEQDGHNGNEHSNRKRRDKVEESEADEQPAHPYKGHNFDMKL
ncbi:hypothetical protein [Paenibacillus sp. sgz302251]|uniref:hypothetical protein n=1 Tax=Paenibacillus sp. sgz302251 TaxID=3414493 RepID=UPI003C797C63